MRGNQLLIRPLTIVTLISTLMCVGALTAPAQERGALVPKGTGSLGSHMSVPPKTGTLPEPGIVVVRQPSSSLGATPWVEWSVTATAHGFEVRQPGRYAAKWGQLEVRSNSPVVIDFEGFGNLVSRSQPRLVPWEIGTAPPLTPIQAVNFQPAEDFNAQDIRLTREEAHSFKCDLWSRITVDSKSASGDYVRKASIVLVLENARDWDEASDLIGTEQD